jgi:hypothetical protein
MRFLGVLVSLFILTRFTVADTLYLTNGRKLEGVILANNATEIRIRTDVGTAAFPPSKVDKIELTKDMPAPATRLASWQYCINLFAKHKWDGEAEQIPATVIDKGVLKFVPYISHRSGNYEVNIYGDPANPACIEIGVYGKLITDAQAKVNCRNFMKSILAPVADKVIVDKLKSDGDILEREGLTFEITPPTAEDAYGGWWISIYNTKSLDQARATPAELAEITVERSAPTSATPTTQKLNADDFIVDWTPREIEKARKPAVTIAPPKLSPTATRPDPGTAQTPTVSRPSSGTVYVRGYVRKDGTYVKPYARSSPKK